MINVNLVVSNFVGSYQNQVNDPEHADNEYLRKGINKYALAIFTQMNPKEKESICKKIITEKKPASFPDAKELEGFLGVMAQMVGADKAQNLSAWLAQGEIKAPSWKAKDYYPLIDRLTELYKENSTFLFAQGVEEAKGGLSNFLNIMLTGKILGGEKGPMVFGGPQAYSGHHGPYFVLCNMGSSNPEAFVVPNESCKIYFYSTLNAACENEIISSERKEQLKLLIVTAHDAMDFPDDAFLDNGAFIRHLLLAR